MARILSPEISTKYLINDPEDREEFVRPLFYDSLDGLDCIPPGFRSDGSSVPRIFLSFIPKHKTRVAGHVHDYLFFRGIPRKLADQIWADVASSGAPRLTKSEARLGYRVLRATGWWAYRGHRTGRLGSDMDKEALIRLSQDLITQYRMSGAL